MSPFLIADLYVPKGELVRVAQAVLNAQKYQEESWDNYLKKYRSDLYRSTQTAVIELDLAEHWSTIIYYWNDVMWKDVQQWALDKTRVNSASTIIWLSV